MSLLIVRRRFLSVLLSGAATVLGGCGTILYPERRGQPHGRLDWGVVALDGLGLVLFFLPGVIAFAVDFATGAIYLPPEQYGLGEHPGGKLDEVRIPRQELTRERIEQVASSRAPQPVRLVPGEYRSQELRSLDDFWSAQTALAAS